MDYKTYAPASALSPFVNCYWTLHSPAEHSPERQRIVPDGCIEMIFHCGGLYKQYIDENESIIQPRSFVFGQVTKPLYIEPTAETAIFAVRFHPDGFTLQGLLNAADMENKATPLELIFGNQGLKLESDMLNADSDEERIGIIESFLYEKLITSAYVDTIIKSSVELILELKGQVSVEELSNHGKISRRQLERKFSSAIGLSPKQLSKIVRMQSALKMMAENKSASLTEIALDGDYYDQAHFIKDFKEFTGQTPKKFYTGNLRMSSIFSST